MRILMFGRGTIATIYGHALQAAGHHVEFYVRPGRAAVYGDSVQVDLIDARRTPLGRRIQQTVPIRLRESLDAGDGFDLVVLSVAHNRLPDAAAFLASRVGDATVLVLGNLWVEPLTAITPLPAIQVIFGFPMAGGGFGDDNVLHGGLLRTVILGTAGTSPRSRELAVQTAFRQAGFHIQEETNMREWLWLHFISDVGMHAQGHLHGGLANMIGNRQALREAFLISRELLPLLHARGVDLRPLRGALLPYRLPGLVAATVAWATAHVPIAQASLAAHTDPDAAEPRAVLRDALQEARRLGVPTPRLEAALAQPRRPAAS
jgi:2-dehydropantoate 2-reductase